MKTMRCLRNVVLSFIFAQLVSAAETVEAGAPRSRSYTPAIWSHCQLSTGQKRFEVLPGSGWDNIVNRERGKVLDFNYTQCVYSEDGQFLLPDNVYLVPLKTSKLNLYSEMFEHFNNYTSTTSHGVNANAGVSWGGFGFSGKFSSESTHIREKQVKDSAVTVRVQARYGMYEAMSQPDTAIHPSLRNRLLDIISYILKSDRSGGFQTARYLSDLIIRDFGTHVVNRLEAGAILAKIDQVKKSYVLNSKEDKSKISASASASFGAIFNVGGGYTSSSDTKTVDEYKKQLSDSQVQTMGGPSFRANFSVNEWIDKLPENLIAIDRHGVPLHYIITSRSLPEVPEPAVYQLIKHIKAAIKRYYHANIVKGCTDPAAPNFDYQANVDDAMCHAKSNNYSFGGVFQTCEGDAQLCSEFTQKNPATAAFSCDQSYEAVQLQKAQGRCVERCHRHFLFWKKCNTFCASYTSFWCSARDDSVPTDHGFIFGGIYSSVATNFVTNTKNCPPTFYAMKLGAVKVCLSQDYELGSKYRLPFAGFFSCHMGNPLSMPGRVINARETRSNPERLMMNQYLADEKENVWPQRCPQGFSQHLASIDHDCAIHYCVKNDYMRGFGALLPVKSPPFESPLFVDQNHTAVDTIEGSYGRKWTRNDDGEWKLQAKSASILHDSNGNTSPVVIILLSVIGTLVIGGVIILVVKNREKLRLHPRRRRYREMPGAVNEGSTSYGTTSDGHGQARVNVNGDGDRGEAVESDDDDLVAVVAKHT